MIVWMLVWCYMVQSIGEVYVVIKKLFSED
jgi:hypothetical protein